ncbi:type III pantothenate kinase [Synechococcus sp. CCY9201]|uniref:type III pantothenate kinase n=1 Tax=unclassified Synechococcus TaxID=2626047 RepID=UPI0018CD34C9|nr:MULTISPECIES: type III pantothenate kinase [unclassified Synechococcus]MEA5421985.1 type III pantothenate kinase [Synechococcus sp. CCY9202]MEA5472885.1 type III pantothenate kinase [Synechococcus sp. CCY9201]QPN68007.1 type III pantothenate kinase [Synechococcus sp. CBW1006]
MRASEPLASWLLIGNSRWHWAQRPPEPGAALRFCHTTPEAGFPAGGLRAWAAVGPVPATAMAGLAGAPRLDLSQVPLREMPAWLGVDRALAGWGAWRQDHRPVLVADAGTALSLTLVDGTGRFRGGRLQAGVALQLRALAAGTARLPRMEAWPPIPSDSSPVGAAAAWPQETAAAMAEGVVRGLAAAVVAAAAEAVAVCPGCRLWLTGGDGAQLLPLIEPAMPAAAPLQLIHAPNLCLEALVQLEDPQARPRSPRI